MGYDEADLLPSEPHEEVLMEGLSEESLSAQCVTPWETPPKRRTRSS